MSCHVSHGDCLVPCLPPNSLTNQTAYLAPNQVADQAPNQNADLAPNQNADLAPNQTADQTSYLAPNQVADQAPNQNADLAPNQTADQTSYLAPNLRCNPLAALPCPSSLCCLALTPKGACFIPPCRWTEAADASHHVPLAPLK
ncbi:filamentous hemagglutinin family domain-containing protein, putative [Babesia ovata]|uniref:Filamentous hemagglutinin family domain-containing protein, putative n=1 Tax=Babesia ovata TaxID=189622 RepID=A0A2H6KHZ1_9APIC|nr:filamentous hemagglutinin family domain-containing protein, putative [Babesia ovata]GBE62605.1 filamentous hemagglutinin family domain-containing protein, putative [Babesia ovata]